MNITKYYLVDWVMYVFIFANLVMIANKNKNGFIFGAVGSLFAVILGCMINSVPMIIVNSLFILSNIKGYLNWSSIFED